MADTLVLYKEIVLDLKGERERINTPRLFNQKQRAVLLSMLDSFENGNFVEVIDLGQSDYAKNLFDYNVWEYCAEFVYDIIRDMSYGTKIKRKEDI
jgi:hypothetical protein